VSTTTNAARVQAFVTAANAFTTCARCSPSKQVNERLAYYGAAGECYSEARDAKNAGDSYQLARQYAAAARNYREGGYFDEMVEVITQHRNALDSGICERLTMAAQIHYFKVYFSGWLVWLFLTLFGLGLKHQVIKSSRLGAMVSDI